MVFNLLAALVVLIHLGFILFCVLGGLLVVWRRKLFWLHLPAVAWAAWIEFSGKICPLTPLENWLRLKGGQNDYSGDFVGHYLLPLLYPASLTRKTQILLGATLAGVNVVIYGYVFFSRKRNSARIKE